MHIRVHIHSVGVVTEESKVAEQVAQLKSVCSTAPHPNETREDHGHVADCVPFRRVRGGDEGRGGRSRMHQLYVVV